MMYCTKCGSDLKGNSARCPVCGYDVQKMKIDLSKPMEVRRESRPGRKPWAPPIPDQRSGPDKKEKPVVAIEFGKKEAEEDVDNDPRYVDGCSVCGSTPHRRCFFTLAPICDRHTSWLQIYVTSMPFGEKVPAAPGIAAEKNGRVPTQMEAEEAGMFFSVKPYHLWKRVK